MNTEPEKIIETTETYVQAVLKNIEKEGIPKMIKSNDNGEYTNMEMMNLMLTGEVIYNSTNVDILVIGKGQAIFRGKKMREKHILYYPRIQYPIREYSLFLARGGGQETFGEGP